MKPEDVEAKKKELEKIFRQYLSTSHYGKPYSQLTEKQRQEEDDIVNALKDDLAPIVGIVDWEAPKLTRADYYAEKDSPHYELSGWRPAHRIE